MEVIDRRAFLALSAGGLSAVGLAGCGPSDPSAGGSDGGVTQWWESGQPQVALDEKLVADNADALGPVEVTFYSNDKMADAIQLSHQSDQMPDLTVMNSRTLGAPLSQLADDGWFQPLALDADAEQRLEGMDLLPGIHVFDGEVCSFPIASPGTNTVNWYHRADLESAGLDPDSPPTTYDEFRDACRKVAGDGRSGLLLPMKVTGRNGSQANFFAQAAGFGGDDGRRFTDGEYAYHADEYVNYVEFVKSLHHDDLIVKGAVTQNVKAGQGQWAAHRSTFYWDGPWIPGNIKLNYPELAGTIGAGPLLVPDKGRTPAVYVGPGGASYFIPAGASHADVANKIMSLLTEDDYQVGWCNIMGKLPRDASAIAKSSATPIWKQVAEDMLGYTWLAPNPVAGTDEVVHVMSALKPVKPDLGTIIQGVVAGEVDDVRGALQQLSDKSNKALEQAIKQAKGKGASVSMDDFVFANWKPGQDYDAAAYEAR